MGQLGDTLRERRASLGITLETAEGETKIRARLLQALEAGEYDRLPNPGYVRGYVSSYARYLELDPVPLLAMYRAETGTGRYHEVNVVDTPVPRRNEQHAVPWRVGVVAFAIVAVIAIGSWLTYRAFHGPATPPPIPATAGSTSASSTGAQSQTAAPPFALKVAVKSSGASAVKVVVDGGTAYNSTLAGGESKTFQVADTAVLTIAKPSQVTVTRDGRTISLPSKSPATITIKAGQP